MTVMVCFYLPYGHDHDWMMHMLIQEILCVTMMCFCCCNKIYLARPFLTLHYVIVTGIFFWSLTFILHACTYLHFVNCCWLQLNLYSVKSVSNPISEDWSTYRPCFPTGAYGICCTFGGNSTVGLIMSNTWAMRLWALDRLRYCQ